MLPTEVAWLFRKECKIYRAREKERIRKRELELPRHEGFL